MKKDTSAPAKSKLIFVAPDTEMNKTISQAEKLAAKYPEILVALEGDRDAAALEAKRLRLKDRRYLLEQSDKLPGLLWERSCSSGEAVRLQSCGRERLVTPLMMLVFMSIRGRFGSLSDQDAMERLKDSSTLETWLYAKNLQMPGRSTICDVLNMISNKTRELILTCQCGLIFDLSLDDFNLLGIDSTSVHANSCWPTDSGVLLRLLRRSRDCFRLLEEKFGIGGFRQHWCKHWLRKLKSLDKNISFACGKPHSKKKIKAFYRDALKTAQKMRDWLVGQREKLDSAVKEADRVPSIKHCLLKLWQGIEADLNATGRVIYYAGERVMNGVSLPSAEKVISISDKGAAYIKKGGREDVVGYKPQLARSGGGFVVSLLLEEGNVADTAMFQPVLADAVYRTGVVPQTVSVDDGYSAAENFSFAREEFGIEVVSFSGAKGKKITPEDEWQSEANLAARNWRSAVESLMFCLKYGYDFARMRRRGIEEVRAEMLEKAIAYNFVRMSHQLAKRAGRESEPQLGTAA